jgi:hypothetical protein
MRGFLNGSLVVQVLVELLVVSAGRTHPLQLGQDAVPRFDLVPLPGGVRESIDPAA